MYCNITNEFVLQNMTTSSFQVNGVKIQVSFDKEYDLNVIHQGNKLTFFYPCGDSNDCSPYALTLPAGKYIFETWGARGGKGGYTDNPYGGEGGYAKGTISLSHSTPIYIQVGNIGGTGADGGYNGGGNGMVGTYTGGSGGGASDIRLLQFDLSNRVIVAGGGGGTQHSYNR